MKLRLFFSACLLALNVFAVQAQEKPRFDTSSLSERGQKSYEKLLNASIFRIGGVGYAGETSEEELALHRLLGEKQAVEALVNLAERATPEGALYGLLGLRLRDANLFKGAVEKYKSVSGPPERKNPDYEDAGIPKGHVQTQRGCIVTSESRLKVVALIEAGQFDIILRLSEDEAAASR